ncbi:MAG TPA: helix-turn-helix domain-containing protein [Patescibacteria group bacterium]|nr:helix-turn-helix domain-containing protein [Patescibacteria group bacterium]
MNKKLLETLENIGLSSLESQIYLALLPIHKGGIKAISDAAQVKRTSAYYAVESLMKKGLLHIELQGLKKVYVPEHPDKLKELVEIKRDQLIRNFPELIALYNLEGSSGVIKYFQGVEGVRNAYTLLLAQLKPDDYYLSISEVEAWYNTDPDFFEFIRTTRSKKHLTTRILVNNTPASLEYKAKETYYRQKVKILPEGTRFPNTITISPSCILFHQVIAPISAILIENPSLIHVHKELFEILWRT